MSIHIIDDPPKPGTEAHGQIITASKIPAIMGVDPFTSRFQLWHQMKGNLPYKKPSKQQQQMFQWGHSAELAMADYWKHQNPGWTLNGGEIAFTNDSLPFPNLVTLDELATEDSTANRRVLEFKTVNSYATLAKWGSVKELDTAPTNYLIQHLAQRGVSGIHDGQILVQGMGAPEVHDVTWNPILWGRIVATCAQFWQSLVDNNPPPASDDTTATYDAVRGLHPMIDRDTTIPVDERLAHDLLQANADVEQAKSRLQTAKNELLEVMGTTHRAVYGGHVIAQREAGRGKLPILKLKASNEEVFPSDTNQEPIT